MTATRISSVQFPSGLRQSILGNNETENLTTSEESICTTSFILAFAQFFEESKYMIRDFIWITGEAYVSRIYWGLIQCAFMGNWSFIFAYHLCIHLKWPYCEGWLCWNRAINKRLVDVVNSTSVTLLTFRHSFFAQWGWIMQPIIYSKSPKLEVSPSTKHLDKKTFLTIVKHYVLFWGRNYLGFLLGTNGKSSPLVITVRVPNKWSRSIELLKIFHNLAECAYTFSRIAELFISAPLYKASQLRRNWGKGEILKIKKVSNIHLLFHSITDKHCLSKGWWKCEICSCSIFYSIMALHQIRKGD